MPCSASRVVPGAHRVVGPSTHRGSGPKEVHTTLWGLRTEPTKPTGQSPYFLVYDSEAILPADVMWDSPTVEQYDEGILEDSRRVDIDGLKEAHCAALVQSARYLRVSNAIMIATSRNAPSTLAI
jgi:hypothetical protein